MKLFIEKALMMLGALCLFDFVIGFVLFHDPGYAIEPRKIMFYLFFGAVYAGFAVYRTLPGLKRAESDDDKAQYRS